MPDNEEDQATAAPERDGTVETASVHNTPPNLSDPGEAKTEDTEEAQ